MMSSKYALLLAVTSGFAALVAELVERAARSRLDRQAAIAVIQLSAVHEWLELLRRYLHSRGFLATESMVRPTPRALGQRFASADRFTCILVVATPVDDEEADQLLAWTERERSGGEQALTVVVGPLTGVPARLRGMMTDISTLAGDLWRFLPDSDRQMLRSIVSDALVPLRRARLFALALALVGLVAAGALLVFDTSSVRHGETWLERGGLARAFLVNNPWRRREG